MEEWIRPDTGTIMRVHDEATCTGSACVVHNSTEHSMMSWPLLWRSDRGIFERTCSHGIGHPDPDQFDFWEVTNQQWQSVHGCDGCCAAKLDGLGTG